MSPRARLLLGAWGPPAGWCLLIFVVSSLPIRTDAAVLRGGDKAGHLVEYAVLGFLAARALGMVRPAWRGPALVLGAGVLGAAWGATDEIHQSLVPERAAEWGDLAADAAGTLLGAAGRVLLARGRGATSPAR